MAKVTLALGGGGTKGFTHIGVIRQLEKDGFEITAIAGTSAGGIVGALYSCGFSTEDIEKFSMELNYSELFIRSQDDAPSLLGLGGLHSLLNKKLGKADFKDAKIDFAVTAVDINSGKEIIINSGSILDAVKATTAIPGIFPAQKIKDLYLVDGGILDPVPAALARWLNPDCPVLAISLAPPMEKWPNLPRIDIPPFVPIPKFIVEQISQFRLGKAMHVFIDSMEITTNTIADLRLKIEKPDVAIFPEVHQYTMFDKVEISKLIRLGEEAVIDSRQKIKSAFSMSSRVNRWFLTSRPPGRLLSEVV